MATDRPHRPGRRHHSDEQLLAYAALSAEQKLRWLHEMWVFTKDFAPPEALEVRARLHGDGFGPAVK